MKRPSILFIAPFDRGVASGGSQRSTAIAEALESRGARVDWTTTELSVPSQFRRAIASLTGPPMARLSRRLPPIDVDHDVLVACHSYLGDAVIGTSALAWVDYHNIEVDHMRDLARSMRGLKRLYWNRQEQLMARLESEIARMSDVVTVATEADSLWLRGNSTAAPLVVPNILPRAEAEIFREIRDLRAPNHEQPELVFVGTLDYLPNIHSVDRFLHNHWRAIHRCHPSIVLSIVGRCAEQDAERWSEFENVSVLGFVHDLRSVLRRCSAAILPLEMAAGSSLRVLALALAGVPMIGSPDAFRAYPHLGRIAKDTDDWVRLAGECRDRPDERRIWEIADWAEDLQHDPAPFDALWNALDARR